MSRIARVILTVLAFAGLGQAQAQSDTDLLRIEDAFALTTTAVDRNTVRLEWKIADGYYLYRSRIRTGKPAAGLSLGSLELPPGKQKHDEFLGEVEVYHDKVAATQPVTLDAGDTAEFSVSIQGCHELDPKICYPPHATTVSVKLPPAEAAAAAPAVGTAPATIGGPLPGGASAGDLKSALGQLGKPAGDAPMDTGTENTAAAGTEKLPLPPEQAFVFETIATGPGELLARWTMPKGYYLYRDKTKLTPAADSGVKLGQTQWPAGVLHRDEHFGEVTVYFDQVELPILIGRERGDAQTLKLAAEFQGCENDGVCYPIMTRTVSVDLPAASAEQLAAGNARHLPIKRQPTAAAGGATTDENDESRLERLLREANLFWIWIGFFIAGLGLAFTPCVYPMIPILSGIIAGAGADISTRRATTLSVVYVLANALVFALAGIVAGLAGINLTAAFQNPWILSTFALLFVVLALSMFGFYELQLPSSWMAKISDISNRQKPGSIGGVAVMGALSALIVGPCVTPALAVAIGYISQTGDPVIGGNALFALGLGMGAPLVFFGATQGQLLPRAGAWMDAVKAVFGVSFLALAIWMLARFLDPVWTMLMTGALAVACGIYLGALERLPEDAPGWRRLWKALGVMLLIAGSAQLVGAFAGSRDPLQPLKGLAAGAGAAARDEHLAFRTIKSVEDLQRALGEGKPVLLDFYADWCVSCKEMEKFTFTKPEVHAALTGYTVLKADVTANDETDQALLKHFGLFGPPATIFFGSDGQERRGQRLIGFEAADRFVARAAKAGR